MMTRKKSYQYPWRHNNKFDVLVDGVEYFSSMLDAIKKAKKRILLEAYLFESGNTADNFISELCLAKKRNVDIFVLLDEYGTKGLSSENKDKLTSSGINLFLYNPTNFFSFGKSLKRDHRKLLTVDDNIAFIGGAGITDEFMPNETSYFWHDVMLKIQGNIVLDLNHSFNEIWRKKKQEIFFDKKIKIEYEIENKSRILIAAGTEKNEIIRAIINRIRSSKKQVWLTSPYFISSWKVRRALRFAAKKGVDVRLIFPGQYSDHKWISYGIQRYYRRMLKAKVSIYEFQPRFTHTKIILCDDWFTIGSSNLDRWSQFLNLDANIEVYDKESHQKILNLFNADFSQSKLIELKRWHARPYIQHLREAVSGIVIRILGIISRKFKR